MKPRPDNVETSGLLGYLGDDDVLYCSTACASARGQASARPVDQEEYPLLSERGVVTAGSRCPVCGSEYPFDWPPA